jgi:large subunit ribosomal protein L17
MMANMLKNLIDNGRIETTVVKAKVLRRYADKMITLAKKNTLAARRQVMAKLMIHFNHLDSKQARRLKEGDQTVTNVDRRIVKQLFDDLGPRFAERNGGYTRIVRTRHRVGDNASMCLIEYIND